MSATSDASDHVLSFVITIAVASVSRQSSSNDRRIVRHCLKVLEASRLSTSITSKDTMPHPLIGKPAPALTLPSTPDGTPYTLPIGQKVGCQRIAARKGLTHLNPSPSLSSSSRKRLLPAVQRKLAHFEMPRRTTLRSKARVLTRSR